MDKVPIGRSAALWKPLTALTGPTTLPIKFDPEH
jgi:hypothetical protein